jgi:ATP-dependent helicase/DNAse subunit B
MYNLRIPLFFEKKNEMMIKAIIIIIITFSVPSKQQQWQQLNIIDARA